MKNLEKSIADYLVAYTKEVEVDLKKAQKRIAQQGAKTLRETSPDRYGDYKKGWTIKKTNKGFIVHNRTRYQLTHLLEHGHAKIGGGRVPGISHIEPVEKTVIDDYIKEVERAIRK